MLLLAVVTLLAISSRAQTLTIGPDFSGAPNNSVSSSIRTVIDLTTPASATGVVTSVHLYWSTDNCPGALKVRFFRPSTKLTMVGERGPFNVTSRDSTLTLSPPVPVMKGDVIGIVRLTTCGTLMSFSGDGTYAYFSSDFVGPYVDGYNYVFGARLALGGTGVETEDVLRGVIPVVGSVAGIGGANFKTSLQLLHAGGTSGSISGKLVFHPSGTSGTAADPTITYTLSPGQVQAFPDIAAAFGRSGIGSIDLLTTQTSPKPVIVTRVFNDAGAAGTSGLSEDLIDISDPRVINAGETGYLVAPVEPSRTRFNIGVRTLPAGATLIVVLRDSNGVAIRTLTKTYSSNWFEQVDSGSFLGGTPLGGNQSIAVTVVAGSAIVYGATTDNTTNDPAIQYASVAPASP